MAAATIGTMLVGSVATFTLGEFVAFIALSTFIISTLNYIDETFDLTDKLVKQLREISQNAVDKYIARMNDSINTATGMSALRGNGFRW